jgi:hypothetical protein
VGHGARGLQPRRHGVGLFHARPGAQPRLSLGRGRHRRLLRRPAAPLPVGRPLERTRSDPEGTAVRVDQRRRQSRRGRQGALLLYRRHPQLCVRAHALQAAASRIPLRMVDRGERAPPRFGSDGIRVDRHRHLRRGQIFRRRDRVRQGGRGRRAHAADRPQPRPGAGVDPRAAANLVPQHLELVAGGEATGVTGAAGRARAR